MTNEEFFTLAENYNADPEKEQVEEQVDPLEVDSKNEVPEEVEPSEISDTNEDSEELYLENILAERGIDIDNIEIDGEFYKFEDLSSDSQLYVLTKLLTEKESNNIPDRDIQLIEQIKSAGYESLSEYIESLQNTKSKDVEITDTYETMSLDDIFINDLYNSLTEEEFESLTEEDIKKELEEAKKSNFFSKKMEASRKKLIEQREQQIHLTKQQEEEKDKKVINSFVTETSKIKDLDQIIELDNESQELIYDFLFTKDSLGKTKYDTLMSKPDQIYKMIAYYLFGKEALNELVNVSRNTELENKKKFSTKDVIKTNSNPRQEEVKSEKNKYFGFGILD